MRPLTALYGGRAEHMVSAEVETEDLQLRLFSNEQPAAWRHCAMYPLHDSKERRYMLDYLLPDSEE